MGGQHLWSVGYFCRSVGDITDKIIKEYIENQSDEYEENFKIVQWVYSRDVLSALILFVSIKVFPTIQ